MRSFLILTAAATLLTSPAWLVLLRDSTGNALHSYTVAIPLISAWLVRQNRTSASAHNPKGRVVPLSLGVAALAIMVCGEIARRTGAIHTEVTWLSTQILGWVLAVWAAASWCFPSPVLRAHRFALGFLLFTVPLPTPWVDGIEFFLQHASAGAVEAVFRATHVTYYRDARSFWLPDLRFEVAKECSGIRSTLVLFITSLVAGQVLLQSPWRRAILVLAVIPLGILRNTLRICTITLLSVYVDPQIINSSLHHRGGPVFFAISLVPLFALLWWFRRQERRRTLTVNPRVEPSQ